jgi:hypothetical protein
MQVLNRIRWHFKVPGILRQDTVPLSAAGTTFALIQFGLTASTLKQIFIYPALLIWTIRFIFVRKLVDT